MQRINNNILVSSTQKFFYSSMFFTFATFLSHLNWFPPLNAIVPRNIFDKTYSYFLCNLYIPDSQAKHGIHIWNQEWHTF